MFDWNDEELANIIWDEAAESDDHIVPYPEACENYSNKKEWNHEMANVKPTEQKSPETKVNNKGINLESSSGNEGVSASNLSNGVRADLSLSKASRIQESLGTKVSNELTENSKYYFPRRAVTAEDPRHFQSTDEGKEPADFVDYGWANIGSFDDLDRIFRTIKMYGNSQAQQAYNSEQCSRCGCHCNDDPLYGQVSLDDADELWSSSSKDAPNSSAKLFSSVNSLNLESGLNFQEHVDSEYLKQNEKLSLATGSINNTGFHGLPVGNVISADVGGKSRDEAKDQTDLENREKAAAASIHQRADNIGNINENKNGRQKKLLKSRRKTEGKTEEKMYHEFFGNWPLSTNSAGRFNNHFPPQLVKSSPNSTLTQHRQLQGFESLQYQQIPSPLVHHSFYATTASSYPSMPSLSHNFPGDLQHQPPLGHESGTNRRDKSADGFVKSLTMTPQEKIEKLRRRQQMQAMLAIQKQQQQFNNQVPTANPISPKYPQEVLCQREKGDLDSEEIFTLPALDPKSPLEQDDSNTVSTAVDHYSLEETILCRLQEIISKLDFKIRLSIRDSLFRLAQSATQRHYANDTSSSNKNSSQEEHDLIAKGEMHSHSRSSGMPDAETETNPIDRTVAHLLFHRPFELLGNFSDAPESPISTKLSCEHKVGFKNLPMEFLPNSSKGKRHISQDGSNYSWTSAEAQPMKSSPCVDTSENTSNSRQPDDAVMEYEAS